MDGTCPAAPRTSFAGSSLATPATLNVEQAKSSDRPFTSTETRWPDVMTLHTATLTARQARTAEQPQRGTILIWVEGRSIRWRQVVVRPQAQHSVEAGSQIWRREKNYRCRAKFA
jgi:hypothetical protein